MNSMSFSTVARDHLDAVYRYLLATTKDAALAEDLTSETFERALRRWHRFDPRRAGEKTWLLMLARSAALDHFRAEARRHRREERFAGEQDTEAADVEIDLGLSPALEEALAQLSAAEREVIALRVVVELDGDTAAKVLGISRTACSTRLSRALRKLEEKVSVHVAV
jgi:RNA polymerase sigma-70 factor, ECF subfamily